MAEHLRHDEVEELLGAYALDAVDDAERAAVDAHLATCPRCRAEVDGHRAVAEFLASTGAPAPEQLWDRIADAISGETPPPMRLVVDDAAIGRGPAVAAPSPLRRWNRALLAAAAAVVAVALVGTGVAIGSRGDDDVDGTGGLATAALQAFESPDARVADLDGPDGRPVARVAVLPDGEGYVLADGLPDLEEGIYQLWASDGTTVVSLGVMGAAPGIVPFHAGDEQVAMMISQEDEPATEPTSEAVAFGELS